MDFDLLKTVESGGCSAKLPAGELNKVLGTIPKVHHPSLIVDIDTHDDAGVYKIREDYALIQTTDFFPPVCSDAYDFGQVAAANALSDIYAMGGEVLTALNIMLFPPDLPLELLKDILRGGQDKVVEAGGVVAGGHTIADEPVKYGLAVTGWAHPDKIITNTGARPGDVLILTKPLGTGVIIAAKKIELAHEETYFAAVDTMKLLNKEGARIMSKYHVRCATDITGFGLLGHGLKMAEGSGVSLRIEAGNVPLIQQVEELIEMGCIPGAAFRNLEFVEDKCHFDGLVDYNSRIKLVDAQTSGGLLICCDPGHADKMLEELQKSGYPNTSVIGEVLPEESRRLIIQS